MTKTRKTAHKEQLYAEALFDLIEAWLPVTHLWEDYVTDAANGVFKTDTDAEFERLDAIKAVSDPIKTATAKAGFAHSDLLSILPYAFRTTKEEREQIVADLRDMVHDYRPPWE